MTDAVGKLNATEVSASLPVSVTRSALLKREMPGLDALRGVAVLSVVLYHGLLWQLPEPDRMSPSLTKLSHLFTFGWLGVSLFFVLSGFLITGILLDTRIKKHSLKNFYVRRALRILPLYFVTLGWFALKDHTTWGYVALCVFNLANLAESFPLQGAIYGPLWSLAVEEQFYLVWPWLTRWLGLRGLAYVSLGMIGACPILRVFSELHLVPLGDTHTMTWLIADNLAMGGLLAIFLRSRYATAQNTMRALIGLLGGAAVLLGVGVKLHWMHRTTPYGAGFQSIPFQFLFTGLLLAALQWGDRPGVLRATAPLRFLGYISYGLYMFHVLLFGMYEPMAARLGIQLPWVMSLTGGLVRFAIVFSVALLLCFLSRRYFEEYFLRLKSTLAPNTSTRRVLPNG